MSESEVKKCPKCGENLEIGYLPVFVASGIFFAVFSGLSLYALKTREKSR